MMTDEKINRTKMSPQDFADFVLKLIIKSNEDMLSLKSEIKELNRKIKIISSYI